MKLAPSQARSQETFEMIVETTGKLLEEVGFERLSTNMVCKKAKLSPPALYRYFPNKYAIMRELGERLMKAQDDAVLEHVARYSAAPQLRDEILERMVVLQLRIVEITRNFPGNIAIMRALRAVPVLQPVRIESRDMIAVRVAESMKPHYAHVSLEDLTGVARLTTELGYAALEMVIEEPHRDAHAIMRGTCWMVSQFYESLSDGTYTFNRLAQQSA